MTIPLHPRRTAKPCPFKTFHTPLTSAISTLARPPLNPFPCYIFPATGGRVSMACPERGPRLTEPRLSTVDCRLLAVCESPATFCIRIVSPTYAKVAEYASCGKCRRAYIPDLSRDISHFLAASKREGPALGVREGPARRSFSEGGPLSDTSLQYCAAIAPGLPRMEPRGIPARPGSPRCGHVPFAYRCPDAHD
jgi:hypothetical protein